MKKTVPSFAIWILPSGAWIGEKGVTPDVVVEDVVAKEGETEVDELLNKALESF